MSKQYQKGSYNSGGFRLFLFAHDPLFLISDDLLVLLVAEVTQPYEGIGGY